MTSLWATGVGFSAGGSGDEGVGGGGGGRLWSSGMGESDVDDVGEVRGSTVSKRSGISSIR